MCAVLFALFPLILDPCSGRVILSLSLPLTLSSLYSHPDKKQSEIRTNSKKGFARRPEGVSNKRVVQRQGDGRIVLVS